MTLLRKTCFVFVFASLLLVLVTPVVPAQGQTVLYREIFPNNVSDTGGQNGTRYIAVSTAGWSLHAGSEGKRYATTVSATNLRFALDNANGSPTDVAPVNSNPNPTYYTGDIDQATGFVAVSSASVTQGPRLFWTDEYSLDRASVSEVSWTQNNHSSVPFSVALKIDGVWYVSDDTFFDTETTLTSKSLVLAEATGWHILNFNGTISGNGTVLALADSALLPGTGTITAFGLYTNNWVAGQGGMQFDSFTLLGDGVADTEAPVVAITSPADGASVSGTVDVTATATDNVGVAGVQFKLDGTDLGAEDTEVPYSVSWDTTTAAEGDHVLTAVARDAAGNTMTSAAVNVTVTQSEPGPVVLYREVFPNDTGAYIWEGYSTNAGWRVFYNNPNYTGFNYGNADTNWTVQPYEGSPTNVPAVNSNPRSAEQARGFIHLAYSGKLDRPYFYFTEEYSVERAEVTEVRWTQGNRYANDAFQVALKIDGVWYVSTTTFTNAAVMSDAEYSIGAEAKSLVLANEPAWRILTAVSDQPMGLGEEDTALPATGTITAFGLYNNSRKGPNRFDSFTLLGGGAADTQAPVVAITAPADGATVSGSVDVTATASDNVGVVGVQFKLDGADLGAEDTAAPFQVNWDTTTASNGDHVLTAVARDAAGNTTTSAGVTVTVSNGVADTEAPEVTITAPADGATVSGSVDVTATATDNVGVVGVQFKLDGADLGAEDTAAPFQVTWDTTTASNGDHVLTAVARDAAGNTTTSTAVTVSVDNEVDDTAPTVTITAPVVGETVSGVVSITAEASDDVGVVGVQFQLDGIDLGAEDATPPYELGWNTAASDNGVHVLTAVARDAAGNSTTSAPVSVTVDNEEPELPVYYREVFPNNTGTYIFEIASRVAGWRAAYNHATSGYLLLNYGNATTPNWSVRPETGSPSDLPPVNSNPASSEQANGFVRMSYSSAANRPWFYFTEEYSVDRADIGEVRWTQGNARATDAFQVALRIDGVWYASASTFTNPPVADDVSYATGAVAHRLVLADEPTWYILNAAPGAPLALGGTTSLPASGLIDGFGLYINDRDGINRFDSYTLIGAAADTEPPTVTLTTPEDGALVSGWMPVAISASDNVAVAAVRLQVDGVDAGVELTVPPYEMEWNSKSVANGVHTLTAVAQDATGFTTISVPVTVTVDNPADNEPPTVVITSPANGATVHGTIVIAATAADNDAVFGVQFKLNGENLGPEITSAPYELSWNTFAVSNGPYTLTAVARDLRLNEAMSVPVSVTVNNLDTALPTVEITSPTAGSTVSGTIDVTATASDNVGVVGVQFKLDGTNLGAEDTTEPYSVSWDTTTAATGGHTLTATSRDAVGNTATSSVNVLVDNEAPTVSLTAPVSGHLVSGTVQVKATASDNVAVLGVQFKVDGVAAGAEDTTEPYSFNWDTTALTGGDYTLTAEARDAAGHVTTSPAVVVTVENDAPTVAITSPADGVTVSGTILLTATATDNVEVAGVQFKVDDANIGVEDTMPPYELNWHTAIVPNGSHTLTAVARDLAGNTTSSAPVTITVNNAADIEPPAVMITTPAPGSTVSGTILVTADATDNVLVRGVQFMLDGVNLGALDTTAPYSVEWHTRASGNGSHILTATVWDAAGNTATSADVPVVVDNPTGALTFYVSTTGSDVTGDGSLENPWETIAYGLAHMAGGDTLVIRGGTYVERIGPYAIPSGTSDDNRTTIRNYDGEKVIIQPAAGMGAGVIFLGTQQYITIKADARYNLVLDAINIGGAALYLGGGNDIPDSATNIRIENVEIKNAVSSGILRGHLNEFINLWIHHNGSDDRDHGIYVGGSDNLVDGCVIHDNSGYGIHNYSGLGSQGGLYASRNVYRNNTVYRNGLVEGKAGIIISTGSDNQVYNNLVYENGGNGLNIYYGPTNTLVYNNTFYGNIGRGIDVDASVGPGTVVRNNISFANTISNFRGTATEDHNLFGVDPQFLSTDTASADFLKLSFASTAAIDQGADTGGVVTTDHWGVARPQGAAYDIGAHEYVVAPGDAPEAPAVLLATTAPPPLNYGRIDLVWTDVADENGYLIERKTGVDGTWTQIASVGADIVNFRDETCGAGTTYYYRVRAVNLTGYSDYSPEVFATTDEVVGREGHWRLDETSGLVAYDSSGYGHHGTLQNGPVWTPNDAGTIGYGLRFDGVDDIVDCGAILPNLPSVTVSAWINANSVGENSGGRIVHKAAGGGTVTQGWQFLTQGTNQLAFTVDYTKTDLNRVSLTNVFTPRKWYHVVATWNGTPDANEVRLYVNGVEVSYAMAIAGSGARVDDSASNLYLGNEPGLSRTFNGMLYDVRVYNRAISASEVEALYRGTLPLVENRYAATRYVSPTGSDTTGDGSFANPWQTISKGLQGIASGDRLVLRGGTYTEWINNTIPAGLSDSARTIIETYGDEVAIIKPNAGASRVLYLDGTKSFITIRGSSPDSLIFDATNADLHVARFEAENGTPHHIRVENATFRNSSNSGILATGYGHEFINLHIHHNGETDLSHGIYFSGWDSLFENLDIHDNSGFGLHLYESGGSGNSTSRNTVRNSRMYRNGLETSKAGIIVSTGSGNIVYNNLCYDNGGDGIVLNYSVRNSGIYNNTVFRNGGGGLVTGSAAGANNVFCNNISFGNGGANYRVDGAVVVTESHNLFGVDPGFLSIDPANSAFLKLSSGASAAIDQGTDQAPIDTIVTTDHWGVNRPQGTGIDIGASEFVPSGDTIPPTVTITAPANGATVTGVVDLEASASDDVGVLGVQFKVNGVDQGAEDDTAPYSTTWDTTLVANGSYALTAVGRDAAANLGTSPPVTVTVNNADVTPPTVSITQPAADSLVVGTTVVKADAWDLFGVVGVQFKLDGANLGAEDTEAPYLVEWDTTTASTGTHTLTAVARDGAGNWTESAGVPVRVDNTPPTVAVTAPAEGAFLIGLVTVSATADDNVGVVGVQFKLDGANLGAEDTVAPFEVIWNTGTSTNAVHTLTAVARDASGNWTESAVVNVTVDNGSETVPPTVAITTPAEAATLSETVLIAADAIDNVGVVGVQFKLDGADLGAEDSTSPYEMYWDTTTASDGAHVLTAVARDAAGNVATSAEVNVTIDNSRVVLYREIFPNNVAVGGGLLGTDYIPVATAGWYFHYNDGGVEYTSTLGGSAGTSMRFALANGSGAPVDAVPVNSNPDPTYYSGPEDMDTGFLTVSSAIALYGHRLYWTDEYSVDRALVTEVAWNQNNGSGYPFSVALRIDGKWYVSTDLFVANDWSRQSLVLANAAGWRELNFVPGTTLGLGAAASLPVTGTITGFGLYMDSSASSQPQRFDSFTLISNVTAAAPIIYSSTSASGVYGEEFSYTIDATGSPTSFGATGLPAGLTLDTQTGVISGAPAETGTFNVELSATNANGTGTVTLVLTIDKATATVTLGDLNFVYDGAPHAATATTTPGGLTVTFTYDGSTVAPIDAGSYAVVATVEDANYAGTATGTLVIGKASQVITFPNPGNKMVNAPPFALTATASSGLPVSYAVVSGPATVVGDTVTVTGVGTVILRASQEGNVNYLPAPEVEVSFVVSAAPVTSVTVPSATGMGDITVSTNTPGCSLFNVKAKTEAESGSPDPSHDYPYGLVEFCVSCAAANVTITFPGSVDGMPYRKYGPTTPGDEGTRGWYTFSDVTQSGNVVTLQLKDGQLGDDTGVDGVIVDQGGPAQQQGAEPGPTAIPTLNEWGIIILMALLGLVSIHYLRRLERA